MTLNRSTDFCDECIPKCTAGYAERVAVWILEGKGDSLCFTLCDACMSKLASQIDDAIADEQNRRGEFLAKPEPVKA